MQSVIHIATGRVKAAVERLRWTQLKVLMVETCNCSKLLQIVFGDAVLLCAVLLVTVYSEYSGLYTVTVQC
jgi:hypothetical protein